MNQEESTTMVNEYMRRIDRRAGQIAFKAGESVAFSALTYQGLKVEVGLAVDDQGETDLLTSVSLMATPRRKQEAFYKQLLRWNNFMSGIGHFSLGADENTVFLVCRRPVAGLDFEEFEAMMVNMTQTGFGAIQAINQMFR